MNEILKKFIETGQFFIDQYIFFLFNQVFLVCNNSYTGVVRKCTRRIEYDGYMG